MRKDVASKAMPDFRKPAFRDTLALLVDKHLDLASAYLTTLTALTLGLECEFIRAADGSADQGFTGLKEFPLPVFYKVSSGPESDYFWGSVSTTRWDPKMAMLTRSKVMTRNTLAAAGIQTAFGGLATAKKMVVLDEMAKVGISRVLVKPNHGSRARGIMANITLAEARAHIEAHPDEQFVAEQYIVGTEYRIFTVGGDFCECYAKLRDHVVGNGRKPVAQLLKEKMLSQLSNPDSRAHAKRNKSKAQYLVDAGMPPDYVPKLGEFVWLTDDLIPKSRNGLYEAPQVSDQIKQLTREICTCLNADSVAIDLIDRGEEGSYILEINAKPGYSGMCFPANAPWNLRLPEAMLRNSLPNHKDNVRRVKSYNFLKLLEAYRSQSNIPSFFAKDFVEFE